MNVINRLFGMLSIAALMMSGCTSVRTPPVLRGSPAKLTLNFQDCDWDVPRRRTPDGSAQFKEDFLSALGRLVYINMEERDPDGINIAVVRIENIPRGGIGPTIAPMLFSTPIVPLALVRNRYYERINLSYALADSHGEIVRQARRQQIIRGSFCGWSFTRLLFRHKTASRIYQEIPALAAEMLVEDVVRYKFE